MPTSIKPARADSLRNRERLLAAAEEEFVAHGSDASIADIAKRAGIAKATVFRHFATKDDLVTAVVATGMSQLTATARQLATSDDPGAALLEFLTVAADQRQQRDVTYLMTAATGNATVEQLRTEVYTEVATLVERARDAKAIRPDITALDVFLLICAPVHVVENLPAAPPDLWRRYLGIIFDGMRPQGASPLARPAPEWPEAATPEDPFSPASSPTVQAAKA